MLISVIVIFYNSEKYIHACLDSLVRQQKVNMEILAINDCSTDNTLNVLNDYHKKFPFIKIFSHSMNLGISEARNTGLKHITGDCFYLIDGDDTLSSPLSLKLLADKFDEETDFVQGSYNIIKGNDIERKIIFQDETCIGFNKICKLFDNYNFIYTHNKLFNSKYANNFFLPSIYHEDRIWNASIFKNLNKIVSISYPTYNYYINNSNTSNLSRMKRKYIESGIKYITYLKDFPPCWKNIKETFIIVDILKPLYLFERDERFRKEIRNIIESHYPLKIDTSSFPRFTKLLNKLINKGIPDIWVNKIAKSYIYLMNMLKKPV